MSKPSIIIKTSPLKEKHLISGFVSAVVLPDEIEITFLDKTVNEFCKEAHEIAKSKGWYDEPKEMGTILALIISEVIEALEADRKGDSENFVEELADVCIRIFDLCGSLNLDLNKAIEDKMEVNKKREYKHGKRY